MRKTGMKVLFFVTLWFNAVSLSAGTYSDSLAQNTKRYRIGFTATALINKHPGLQLTQTYRLNRWFSADLESIFSFDALFLDRRFVHNYGFRVRPGIRFHFTPEKANHDFSVKFLIHYRYVHFKFEDDDVERAGGAYTEDIRESVSSDLLGYGLTIDFHERDYENSIHMGLGFIIGSQFTTYSSEQIPDTGYLFMETVMRKGQKRAYLPIIYFHYLF